MFWYLNNICNVPLEYLSILSIFMQKTKNSNNSSNNIILDDTEFFLLFASIHIKIMYKIFEMSIKSLDA